MSDEPGHKAMLYFLEVLMNSTGPLTISQLAGRFGSSNFTSDMRTAAGGNESGLKQFLLKYPSLFTIKGNMVSLCDGKEEDEGSVDGKYDTSTSRRSLPDVSVEMEAVQFFQTQLAKREERWVLIKSLAGHLSQTNSEIRNIVGPQLDFKKWLLRHMHIFEVQGDLVSLREGLSVVATPANNRRITFDLPEDSVLNSQTLATPKTPPLQRKNLNKNGLPLHRSHSFGDRNQMSNAVSGNETISNSGGPSVKRHDSPVTMTANEYKAVMYLKDLLERRGCTELSTLLMFVNQSADGIRSTIGSSVMSLEAFLSKSSAIFSLTPGTTDEPVNVDLVKNAKLSVIITGSRPNPSVEFRAAGTVLGNSTSGQSDAVRGPVNEGKGKIFHVAKLWGIIDLGDHEHVFFDRSIMKQPMDDLQKHFEVGEMLSFRATPAHKSSRAKWKATHVWREGEGTGLNEIEKTSAINSGTTFTECSIEDEINEFLPRRPDASPNSSHSPVLPAEAHAFGDAQLSGAGVIPIWNFKADEEKNKRASVCVVPESYQMSASVLSDLRFISEFSPSFLYGSKATSMSSALATLDQAAQSGVQSTKSTEAKLSTAVKKQKEFISVACQTVSTSDIIATQLYQDS